MGQEKAIKQEIKGRAESKKEREACRKRNKDRWWHVMELKMERDRRQRDM